MAPGFDHITAAIGAAQSSRYGADLICYITPAEHLALPTEEDVRQGVKAAKIAAYIGDMNKYPEKGRQRDKEMSKARRDLDWEKQFSLALFPEDARAIRGQPDAGGRSKPAPCAAISVPHAGRRSCLRTTCGGIKFK